MGRIAALLVVVALGIGAYVWWTKSARESPSPTPAGARPEAAPAAAGEELSAERPKLVSGVLPKPKPAPVPETEDSLRREVFGRVQDADGKAVSGASVRLVTGRAGEEIEGTTDAEGRFTLISRMPEVPVRMYGHVFARHGTRVGVNPVWLGADDGRGGKIGPRMDAQTIVLADGAPLDVHVTSACPGGVPARVLVLWSNFPSSTPLADATTDASGRVRFEGLRPGPRRVVAATDGCGRVEAHVVLPRADASPLALELPVSRTVTATVVEQGTEKPVPSAEVEFLVEVRAADGRYFDIAVPLPRTVTGGADGKASLAGFGPEDVLRLKATASGYPPPNDRLSRGGPGGAQVKAGETEARIELARARTIAWPVKAGATPVPAEGANVRLTPWTNSGVTTVPPSGRMEGGRLVVSGWGPGHAAAYAHAPDGSVARLQAQAGTDVGYETAFYAVRTIAVTVTLEGEGPAVGWSVTAHDQGNNAVAPAVTTDASGTARLTDLYGGPGSLVDVRVASGGHWSHGASAGTVDLARQDGRLEVTIPREREVVLAVRIDGGPGLPPPPTMLQVHSDFLSDVTRDEAASELRFRWRPPAGVTTTAASLTLAGFVPTYATLTIAPGTEPIRGTLELQRAATLLVRVDLPADGSHRLVEQRFDEAKGTWPEEVQANSYNFVVSGSRAKVDDTGVARITPLKPGRYRVFDAFSGSVSSEVVAAAGDQPSEVRLDLRRSGWVKGRVEVPEGESLVGASVARTDVPRRSAPGMLGFTGAVSVNTDGAFWFRVPGDRPVHLRAVHSLLRADPREGAVEVREPREGVVLKLVRGPTATVRFERAVLTQLNPGSVRPLSVRLYAGEPTGEPHATLSAMLASDGLSATFGGFDPGTWTVRIDAPPFAPTVLRSVTLRDGANDLGTATLAEGSSFVLEVKVKEGQSPPRYSVFLISEADPTYARSTDFAGSEGKVTGLARGRYRLSMHSYGGARALPVEVIEFDGTTEVRRTLDLR